ncbi:hypothetical protein [Ezakiella coagulans]|uniref:hypothetical protein n=1 Tax=Ezakiella coagulans TaxID=46507 RepID=UPI000E30AA88|nr:hypothetical protein [Ezakiella coagulans]
MQTNKITNIAKNLILSFFIALMVDMISTYSIWLRMRIKAPIIIWATFFVTFIILTIFKIQINKILFPLLELTTFLLAAIGNKLSVLIYDIRDSFFIKLPILKSLYIIILIFIIMNIFMFSKDRV